MKSILLIFLLIPGFIYSQTPLIRAENSSSLINDTVLVPITASNFTDIGAITLKIQFSSASLIFIGVVNWDSRLNEALGGIDGNVITLAWDGLNAVSYTYGKIAELKFIYKGGLGEVKFNSALSEIADSSGKAISCAYTDGKVTQITAVNEAGNIPKEFSLSQNYPNPFNPSTVIRYSLQSEAKVSIRVYDLLGQSVSELLNNIQSAGYYEEIFTASGHPSGIYYYSINAESIDGKNNFKAVKKMLLCK